MSEFDMNVMWDHTGYINRSLIKERAMGRKGTAYSTFVRVHSSSVDSRSRSRAKFDEMKAMGKGRRTGRIPSKESVGRDVSQESLNPTPTVIFDDSPELDVDTDHQKEIEGEFLLFSSFNEYHSNLFPFLSPPPFPFKNYYPF